MTKLGKTVNLLSQNEHAALPIIFAFFSGGVGHTAKECPKSSSSASKAKGRAAKGKSDKSEAPLAEDSKK